MEEGEEGVVALEFAEVEQVAAGVSIGVEEERRGGGHVGRKKAQKSQKRKRSCARSYERVGVGDDF